MRVALLLAAAYLLGSTPSSWLAGRVAGVELSERGSGNLGGTNVFRVLGWRYAVPVVVADLAKGFVPAWLFPVWDGVGVPQLALAYGLVSIAGHVWPVFLGFQGGKGVATSGGVLAALAPVATAAGALLWGGMVLLTRTVSVASLTVATALPVLAWLLDAPVETTGFTAALAMFVWWTHRDNVRRLVRGEELRFDGRSAEAAPTPGEGRGDP